MSVFTREFHTVDGVKTAVFTAGRGEPLVFFHGAGTIDGFDFAEPWTDRFRVIVPQHPGFGESGDDPSFTDLHDYVMHYLELFDVLRLDTFHLVGLSLGGNIAARFTAGTAIGFASSRASPPPASSIPAPDARYLALPETDPGAAGVELRGAPLAPPAVPDLDSWASATARRRRWRAAGEHPADRSSCAI